jgi:hypothetical protein
MGLLDKMYEGYKKVVPLQLRTFGETVLGNKNPITEQNLSATDMSKLTDSIAEARAYRQGLLDYKQLNPDAMNNPMFVKDYNQYFSKPEAEEYFRSGQGGTVDYGDINRAHLLKTGQNIGGIEDKRSDWNPTQEAAIFNTLGRFPYTINPDGSVNIQEPYDFRNDPNWLGRMAMGDDARKVNITYTPDGRITPNANVRSQTLDYINNYYNPEIAPETQQNIDQMGQAMSSMMKTSKPPLTMVEYMKKNYNK